MSTLAIARKDFRDAIRSWMLLGVVAVFVIFAAGAAWLYAVSWLITNTTGTTPSSGLIIFLSGICGFFIPLLGLIVGYKSIVGERETGSLQLLLSFPYTRRDVVMGKLIGRTAVVSVSAVVGFLFAIVIVIALSGQVSLGNYTVFVLLSLVLGLVFVSIGVGFSAATRSSTLALVGVVGIFILFLPFIWTLIPLLTRFILDRYTPLNLNLTETPDWAQFFTQFNPGTAYSNALGTVIPGLSEATTTTSTPFYLADSFSFVVLAFWIIVPLALGYYRFNSTDL